MVANGQEERRLADTLVKAKRDVVDISDQLTAELRQGTGDPLAPSFAPGSALWQSVGKLAQFVENAEVLQALQKAGMQPGDFEKLAASVSEVNAAAGAASAAAASAGQRRQQHQQAQPPLRQTQQCTANLQLAS